MSRFTSARRWTFLKVLSPVFLTATILAVGPSTSGTASSTSLVSVTQDGSAGSGHSRKASISADGRFVAFESLADNLVPGDTNGHQDVFVKDTSTGAIARVSVPDPSIYEIKGTQEECDGDFLCPWLLDPAAPFPTEANSPSREPVISADGRFVAFTSAASNLVRYGDLGPVATNGEDVFVHDRDSDGDTIFDEPNTFGASQEVTIRKTETKMVSVSSEGKQSDGSSFSPAMSGDGRFVAFASHGQDLVPRDGNHAADVFVRDLQAGSTERVSLSSSAREGLADSDSPTISDDGRFVAFTSFASTLVPDDMNTQNDVFVHDRVTDQTVSPTARFPGGGLNNAGAWFPSISAGGGWVAFETWAGLALDDINNSPDIYVWKVPVAGIDGELEGPELKVTRVSMRWSGRQTFGVNIWASISQSGRYVSFTSEGDDMVPVDTNELRDVFVVDRDADGDGTFDEACTGRITRVSVPASGEANGASEAGDQRALSADGTRIAFASRATNLGGGAATTSDVFVAQVGFPAALPPLDVVAAPTNNMGEIKVDWTPLCSQTVDSYRIYRTASGGTETLAGSVGGSVTSFIDSGLPHATAFLYRVRSVKGSELSDPSNGALASTHGPPVTAPCPNGTSVENSCVQEPDPRVPTASSSPNCFGLVEEEFARWLEERLALDPISPPSEPPPPPPTDIINDEGVDNCKAGVSGFIQLAAGELLNSVVPPGGLTAEPCLAEDLYVKSWSTCTEGMERGDVTLTWIAYEPSIGPITGYRIYRAALANPPVRIAELRVEEIGSITSYIDRECRLGLVTCTYHVTVFNDAGESSPSESAITIALKT